MEVLASVKRRDLLSEPAHWRLVSIPLELLEWTDAHLKWTRLTRDVQGTFYVDDIRFVPEEVEISPAVVEVSERRALPLS